MSTTLYAHRLSQPSRAAEILLRELGIDYAFHEVDFANGATHTEWFAAINAFETIPALTVEANGGSPLRLGESQAIMSHLCRTAPDRALAQRWYPGNEDIVRTAHIDQWLAWHHGNVRRFDLFHHIMNLHQTLPMLKREIQATLLKPLQDGLTPGFATLETQLERSHAPDAAPTLLGGEHPTLADLAIGCELYQIRAAGYRLKRYPRVAAWLEGLVARPHFRAVSEEIDTLGQEIQTQESEYLDLEAFD